MRPVLLIFGPTASGKSALALALARATGATIVNADSMQVYADLRILTARPSLEEEAAVPHRLFGFVDAAERYSTGRWLGAALDEIAAARAQGRLLIVVGGTGLYFKALTEGLAAAPAAPESVTNSLIEMLTAQGAPALHARLARLDPDGAALLAPNDGPRITRALSVLMATGRPLRVWQAEQGPPPLAADGWAGVTLWPDRAALYAAIATRFGAMIEAGALDEADRLLARGLDASLPAMKAHGMPWIAASRAGAITLDEAIDLGVRDTRRYAKRQFTWMAGQTGDWPRLTDMDHDRRVSASLALWRERG